MMQQSKIVTAILIIGLSLISCSKSEKVQKDAEKEIPPKDTFEPTINLDVQKLTGWVNLMPNSGGKFNITGEIIIPPSQKYDQAELKLNEVKILQNKEVIYSLTPTTREKAVDNIPGGRGLIFSTIKGVSVSPNFNTDKTFDVELVLTQGDEEFVYRVFNKKVEKAY